MADLFAMLQAAAGNAGEDVDPDFQYTTLLLHGDGTNGAQNNTFLDSSTNNFTITRNGNTTQGSFTPFSKPDGAWGNYFDGTGDYLSAPNNAAWNFGTGDFTVEGWFYIPSASVNDYQLFGCDNGSGNNPKYVAYTQSGEIYFDVYFSGLISIQTSGSAATALANQFAHIAVVRNSSVTKIYVNGVEKASGADTKNYTGLTQPFYVGYIGEAYKNNFLGYISSFRVVSGAAVYTAAFTPPTSPITAITNTSLLTCQSNRFVDNSTNNFAITAAGNAKVTPFSPFPLTTEYSPSVNGGSGYFDGSGDYLSIADAAGLRFGTGNFTIQCWIYRNAAGAVHSIAAKGGASTGWVFQVHSDNKLRFTHTTTNIDSTGTIPASAWTHVAVVREGTGTNQVKLYINGVNDGQGTVSTNFTQTEQLNIGADRGNSNVMNGYIAGWKYVVGTAETITVPTAPPTGGTALLNFTNAGIFDNTCFNNLETLADAQINTTTKKYGTGSLEFDGTGDGLTCRNIGRQFDFGTGDFTIEMWLYVNSLASYGFLLDTRTDGITSGAWLIDLPTTGIIGWGPASSIVMSSSAISTGQWYHLAVCRSGSSTKMFLDGVQTGSTFSSSAAVNAINGLAVGSTNSGAFSFNGYIDDLRITKGIARYTAAFTPPDKAFPNVGA